ncbi:hypothetical protein [Salinispira pacifica]
MKKTDAKRIFENLKAVHDTMGGNLAAACIRRGIPEELVRELLRESRESEAGIERTIAALKDAPETAKKIPDEKMARFESLHDEIGEIRKLRKERSQ